MVNSAKNKHFQSIIVSHDHKRKNIGHSAWKHFESCWNLFVGVAKNVLEKYNGQMLQISLNKIFVIDTKVQVLL